jgi:hypothetical protein
MVTIKHRTLNPESLWDILRSGQFPSIHRSARIHHGYLALKMGLKVCIRDGHRAICTPRVLLMCHSRTQSLTHTLSLEALVLFVATRRLYAHTPPIAHTNTLIQTLVEAIGRCAQGTGASSLGEGRDEEVQGVPAASFGGPGGAMRESTTRAGGMAILHTSSTTIYFTHTHEPAHPPTHSLTHSLAHSLAHSLTHSLTHPLTHSLTHSLSHSLTPPCPRRANPTTSTTALARRRSALATLGARPRSVVHIH